MMDVTKVSSGGGGTTAVVKESPSKANVDLYHHRNKQHFLSVNSPTTTASGLSSGSAAQHILNYAAAVAAASTTTAAATSPSSTFSTQQYATSSPITPHPFAWDNSSSNNSALQTATAMSHLLNTGNGVGSGSGGSTSDNNTLAQLIAAASLSVQIQAKDNTSTTSSAASPTKSSSNSNLICTICGQVSREPSDFEQHLLTHISMLDPANQKAYQYGMHLLRMQSLFNGNNGSTANGNKEPNNPTPPSPPSSTTVVMSKKRKLLLNHNNDIKQETIKAEEQSEQSTQNILQQLNMINKSSGSSGANANVSSSSSSTVSHQSATNNTGQMATAFPCTSCHKTFATEVDLKAHLIRHLTQHPFVCVSCGKGFKYEHSLNFHIKSYHSTNGKGWNGGNGGGGSGGVGSDKCSSQSKAKHSESESNEMNISSMKSSKRSKILNVDDRKKKMSTEIGGDVEENKISNPKAVMTVVDENHNHAKLNLNSSTVTEMSYFFGKAPTNFPPDSTIQIRSEKILISLLDAVNVATDQSMLFYKCCLCCVAFPTLDQMNVHIQNVHSLVDGATVDSIHFNPYLSASDADCKYQCDKCAAKFVQPIEYEIHCELHRTLETNNANAPGTNVSTANPMYPFSLLDMNAYPGGRSSLTGHNTSTSNNNLVDFRQLLAKDTDFERKFAAQLLEGSNQNGKNSDDYVRGGGTGSHQLLNEKFPASSSMFDRCSPPPLNGKLNDSNNNSLLYMSLLPEHGSSVPTTVSKNKSYHKNHHPVDNMSKSSNHSISSSPSKASKLASMKNSSTPRHIKEPVDIFEGAGQSLPIEKFPLGDIEETAPGQFKCRFCDKTFDRVFSVHRHERVHTGFKPCICKTCGRGFSEKRNLRHHIIRFHSDGSGRELLRRKRKPKSKSLSHQLSLINSTGYMDKVNEQTPLFMQQLNVVAGADQTAPTTASSLLMNNNKMPNSFISLLNAALRVKPNGQTAPLTTGNSDSLSNLKISLDEMNRSKQLDKDDQKATPNSNNGSRRRKSKPSKKVFNSELEDNEDETDDGGDNKTKEMVVVDVDVHPLEEDTDNDDGEISEQVNKSFNQTEPDVGDETEDDEDCNETEKSTNSFNESSDVDNSKSDDKMDDQLESAKHLNQKPQTPEKRKLHPRKRKWSK